MHEGGWQSGANDPGGETLFGLSRRSYPDLDFTTLTWSDALEIYRRDYWSVLPTRLVPHTVSFQLFDFAVHSGTSTAIRYLQRALDVADDGIWGPVSQRTMDRAQALPIALSLLSKRLHFMTRLAGWPYASRGWTRRIATNMEYAILDAST
jgi:lysozyme family protein